jgi:PKD repeat protein
LLRRGIALSVGALLCLSVSVPPAASAASADTIYVDNTSGANCSDSGTGTPTVPFCTIQAAADVVEPGQTVQLAGAFVESVTISRSGTASAPITFTGGTGQASIGAPDSATLPAFAVTGATDVAIRNVTIFGRATSKAVVISDSSRITVDGTNQDANPGSAGYLEISGSSSHVTVSRNHFSGADATGVQVDAGSHDDTITTNDMFRTEGVVVTGASHVAVTSNTISAACDHGVAITGSTGISVQNNVIQNVLDSTSVPGICNPTTSPIGGLVVDGASASEVTADYNIVYPYHSTDAVYQWAGTAYPTSSAFTSATGQGVHDSNADPQHSDASIDSANSNAPGELTADLYGDSRVDDPLVANTGTGVRPHDDRGAIETVDSVTSNSLAINATQAPVGGTVHTTGTITDTWSEPFTCAADFGDGTTVTDVDCAKVSHIYTKTGTYTVTLTPTNAGAAQVYPQTTQLTVVSQNGPLTPRLSVTQNGALGLNLTVTGGKDGWNLSGETVDFGDGNPPVTLTGNAPGFYYGYSKPGTYTIKATMTDANGATATGTTKFTPVGADYTPYGPVRLADTAHGISTPSGVPAKLGAGGTLRVWVGGHEGVPAGITSAALNLTVNAPQVAGQLTAFADGVRRPATSNLSFGAGQTISGLAIVPVSGAGWVDIHNGSSAGINLTADLDGYFQPKVANGFTTLIPDRLLDTTKGTGPVAAGGIEVVGIAGADNGQLPSTGITAALLNVTAIAPRANGSLTAYPDGTTAPTEASLTYAKGQTISTTMIVPVGADGKIAIASSQQTDLAVDVSGYFSATGRQTYVAVPPVRAVDTKNGVGQPLGPGATIGYDLTGKIVNQSEWTSTIVTTTTVVAATGAGSVSIYPQGTGEAVPPATVNWAAGQTVSNAAMPSILNGLNGVASESFYNSGSTPVNLTVDVSGYFAFTYRYQ